MWAKSLLKLWKALLPPDVLFIAAILAGVAIVSDVCLQDDAVLTCRRRLLIEGV